MRKSIISQNKKKNKMTIEELALIILLDDE